MREGRKKRGGVIVIVTWEEEKVSTIPYARKGNDG